MFNNTGGSLLPVIWFHTSQPVTALFLAQVANPALETLLSLVLVSVVVTVSGTGLVRKPGGAVEKPVLT